MGQFLVRVEAVNLASSIMDTDDLSVIRGGGFANLLLPEKILAAIHLGEMTPVFAGASQAEALLHAPEGVGVEEIEARLEGLCTGALDAGLADASLRAVLPHLTLISASVAFDGDYQKASSHALGRIRVRQLSNLTLDRGEPASSEAGRPCMIDGIRPAVAEISKGGRKIAVSKSVKARQDLGRQLRQQIYRKIGVRDDRDLKYADSFADLVADAPAGLVPSLAGKMAVVYLDGNKFTAARNTAVRAKGIEGAAAFSQAVTRARAAFLETLLIDIENDSRMYCDGRLRFEILMWGGDEARFVLPAWKVAELLPLLAKDMEADHWQFENERLTNAIGILVCNAKMPIARAADLAGDIVEEIKGLQKEQKLSKPKDMLSIQLIESLEPPSGSIRAFREKLYGTTERSAFAISGASGIRTFIDSYARVTDPEKGLPRSQLYGLIADQRLHSLPGQERGQKGDLDASIEKAVRRSRGGGEEGAVTLLRDALRDPSFGISATAPFVGLVRLAEMWDVMRPFSKMERNSTEAA